MEAGGATLVAIDFTHPTAVNKNAEWYAEVGLPFVMGTTGGDREALKKTVEDAKAGGNAKFKDGEYADALGCWLRCFHLHENQGQPLDAQTKMSLHSNCAFALLKLKRPTDALASCVEALRVAPEGSDVSKIHFRCALVRGLHASAA